MTEPWWTLIVSPWTEILVPCRQLKPKLTNGCLVLFQGNATRNLYRQRLTTAGKAGCEDYIHANFTKMCYLPGTVERVRLRVYPAKAGAFYGAEIEGLCKPGRSLEGSVWKRESKPHNVRNMRTLQCQAANTYRTRAQYEVTFHGSHLCSILFFPSSP